MNASMNNVPFRRCKHYFCENCAVEHHKKDKRCAVCREPTGGIFNVAHDIIRKAHAVHKVQEAAAAAAAATAAPTGNDH